MRDWVTSFLLRGLEIETPILNYYFKSVKVPIFTYDEINKARRKMGFLKWDALTK
jgi:hypothetical protein